MPNRRECFFATLNSVVLKSSNFDLKDRIIKLESKNKVTVDFSVTLELLEDDGDVEHVNKGELFKLSISGDLKGTTTIEDEEIMCFSGNCKMMASFMITADDGLTAEKIKESANFYGLQVYPLIREHFTYNLNMMKVNNINIPWDIGLGDSTKNHIDQDET